MTLGFIGQNLQLDLQLAMKLPNLLLVDLQRSRTKNRHRLHPVKIIALSSVWVEGEVLVYNQTGNRNRFLTMEYLTLTRYYVSD